MVWSLILNEAPTSWELRPLSYSNIMLPHKCLAVLFITRDVPGPGGTMSTLLREFILTHFLKEQKGASGGRSQEDQ